MEGEVEQEDAISFFEKNIEKCETFKDAVNTIHALELRANDLGWETYSIIFDKIQERINFIHSKKTT